MYGRDLTVWQSNIRSNSFWRHYRHVLFEMGGYQKTWYEKVGVNPPSLAECHRLCIKKNRKRLYIFKYSSDFEGRLENYKISIIHSIWNCKTISLGIRIRSRSVSRNIICIYHSWKNPKIQIIIFTPKVHFTRKKLEITKTALMLNELV